MPNRPQQTLARPVELTGIAFFSNADVRLRILPADSGAGLSFQRVDLADRPLIPATSEFARGMHRRTAVERDGVSVAMVEHVLAALHGLWIDNAVIQIDGPEPPGFDGSCRALTEAIWDADIVQLSRPVEPIQVSGVISVVEARAAATQAPGLPPAARIEARAHSEPVLTIRYDLDYGADSPIASQSAEFEITPEWFSREIAAARTFILESEVDMLRQQGYGRRLTAADLLVFGTDGVIGNQTRWSNECARHKLLDCVGDLALAGRPVYGSVQASRSGHGLNQLLAQKLAAHSQHNPQSVPRSEQGHAA